MQIPSRRSACIVVFGLLIAAFSLSAIAASDSFDRKGWQDDYTFLKKQLESSYANLAWFASKQGGTDIPALDRRTQRALDQAESDADAKAALLAFVGGFHDGHFSQVAFLEPAITAASIEEPPKPALDKLDAIAGCAALGYVSTRNISFSLPFERLQNFTLESDGVARAFRAGTIAMETGTRIGIVRIQVFRQREFPAICVKDWTVMQQAGHGIDTDALADQIDQDWFEILAAQLRQFKSAGAAAVIVDVGDNGGGNDSGDWSARLLSEKPVHSSRLWMAAASDAKGYIDEQLNDLHKTLESNPKTSAKTRGAAEKAIADFDRRKANIDARYCDMTWVWREQRAWNPAGCSRLIDVGYASGALDYLPANEPGDARLVQKMYWAATVDAWRGAWSGPVYVLTNARTYSSAEMFAATMRNNEIAKIVGATTGGDGCGFMQAENPVTLPHSRLRFRIPDCVRLRADGSDEVAGIKPDLPVLPTEGESDRARAVRLLGLIEDNLHAAAKTK